MNPIISSDLDLAGADPEQDLDEKQPDEVTDITPESLDVQGEGTDGAAKQSIPADDIEAMKQEYFKPLPELEIENEGEYTWDIEEWSKLGRRVHSPMFEVGGLPWKVLFFPAGNQPDHASFYLEQGYGEKPPEDWYACVHFMLVLWNPNDPTIQIRHIAQHRYNSEESDWGFTRFGELRKLFHGKPNDNARPLVENDGAKLTAYVRIMKDPTGVLWHSFINYDSKKQTGMVGLKNQGATCYLNSLIQSLYFTNLFRKAIFQIPTESETEPSKNSAYALQRLFFNLQSHDAAISTSELTTAFGWDSSAIFQQQDVQELTRILMDKMEDRMKGTPYETALKDMFRGYFRTYIDCINVDFTSERTEEFWDIQLDVRGNPTLADSFKSYIQVEVLDGDNKYQAEGFGLQDAKKGVIFESFPPVLHCQLKRYEFDFSTLQQTKVHDRIEFSEEMDLEPYLSEKADRSEDWTYQLHGVLVHSGDLDAGHYYAFIKPTKDGIFYKFDDDRVTPATNKEAMDENFGGDFATTANGVTPQRNPYTKSLSKQRQMSAYMLVYIRKSRVDQVLQDIVPSDVPTHLEEKIVEEKAELERKRKEREEAHLYQQVYFGTDDEFNAHQGNDIFPGVNPQSQTVPGALRHHRVLKTTEVRELTKLIATELNKDEDLVRPWAMVGRQNLTLRPDVPLVTPDLRLEDTPSRYQAKLPLRYWVEVVDRQADGTPDFLPADSLLIEKNVDAPILLFLKQFDPIKQTLNGRGHLFICRTKKIAELGPMILERMEWSEGTRLQLYEEIKAKMIDRMSGNSTFAQAEIGHGDIVCFQKELSEDESQALQQAGKYIDPPSFYDYLHHRIKVTFSERSTVEDDSPFQLELSKILTYDQMAARVAQYLKVEPTHLRFSTVQQNGRPRTFVKRGTGGATLSNILTPSFSSYTGGMTSQRSDWLLYEVLEMSLSEYETKKLVKVTMLSEGTTKEDSYDILVPKTGRISDLIPLLQAKAKLSDEEAYNLRLLEVHGGKIWKELTSEDPVASFNEYVSIYAEQLPKEELEADETARSVFAFHFDKEPTRVHGVPFKFLVLPGEEFSETKKRLAERTGIKGKALDKIKFAVMTRSTFARPDYLQDDDVLADKMTGVDDSLGLDHYNKTRTNKQDVMMIR